MVNLGLEEDDRNAGSGSPPAVAKKKKRAKKASKTNRVRAKRQLTGESLPSYGSGSTGSTFGSRLNRKMKKVSLAVIEFITMLVGFVAVTLCSSALVWLISVLGSLDLTWQQVIGWGFYGLLTFFIGWVLADKFHEAN